MIRALSLAGRGAALVVLYVVLFSAGTALFPVDVPSDGVDPAAALLGVLGGAVLDTALLGAWAARTRLRGLRRWAALSLAFYGVKTLSSQLEALWFMPNVTAGMAPALFGMTLPLALLFPAAVAWAFGRRGPAEAPVWRAPAIPLSRAILGWTVLSAVVYPALFWSAGYFVAFQSPAVREFYGGLRGDGFFAHLGAVFAADPLVVPFEALRGLLWILFVLPLLRTSAGRWWVDALLVGLTLALVQNDVHLIPNPLMSPEIRLYHFVETASSNLVWGLAIGWVLRGPVSGGRARGRPAHPRDVGVVPHDGSPAAARGSP